MLSKVFSVFGESNEKALRKLRPLVQEINALEPQFQPLSDEDLQALTGEYRSRLEEGEALDDLLLSAFAAAREAAVRTLGQRHFDVQLMGGIVLHQGKIAEMKTGEGKTLVATLPVYLNALEGRGVHVITVNDYLAKRDTQWMGAIYHLLGLSLGCLQHDVSYLYDPEIKGDDPALRHLRPVSRQEAYQADITYGTNNEFGFDYLRDNMVLEASQKVQRENHYAIVDEVDNILIDEARTPLIISGPAQESTDLYATFARLVPRLLREQDYLVEEKHRAVSLTEVGAGKIEKWLNIENLYDPANFVLSHYAENALRASVIYQADRDYMVRDGEVVIVDEFTGRLMEGRRYSDGLHQAIEAKEGVKVQRESMTYASITFQNYFRLYHKLAGMTGTAATEAEEFFKIYKLEVVVAPTHMPMVRSDHQDLVFKSEEGKFEAAVGEIEELHRQGRPVLVGTVSIEKSEVLSDMLSRRGIPHQVLNAKQHEREASIIAQAGRLGAVTVATNMAGRGTDIVLGGNREANGTSLEDWQQEHDQVVALGGLYILGTERHEARRIDNQLRGRSGRQGDPGGSRFYASLEDDLLRRFGGDRIRSVMDWAGIAEDYPIENRLVGKTLENSQGKVESYHFETRKQLVEYDDVINRHREVIYDERQKVLSGADLKVNVQSLVHQELQSLMDTNLPGDAAEEWNAEGLMAELRALFPIPPPELTSEAIPHLSRDEVAEELLAYADQVYEQYEEALESERMRSLEREVMLRTVDVHWVQHLTAIENLRLGIGLYAFGQRDPLVMFKMEGHEMFQSLLGRIQHDIAHTVFRYAHALLESPQQRQVALAGRRASPMAAVMGGRNREVVAAGSRKVGRNDSCPCGSGKKYKKCHGMAA